MAQSPGTTAFPRFKAFIILFCFLTMNAFYAHANIECKFKNANTQSIGDFIGAKPTLQTVENVAVPTKISSLYRLDLSPGMYSTCSTGDDGENIFTQTDACLLVGTIDGKALFKTNVTGIAYALAFGTVDNTATAYFAPSTSWFLTLFMDNHDELLKNRAWRAMVEFYQLPTFTGIPANVVSISPVGGTIGKITIGDPAEPDPDDHPKPTITIANMAFTTPIEKPTCTLTVPKSVDLGTYDASDLENDYTLSTFVVVTGNCSNTRQITMKLSTSKTTGSDGTLLANTASSNAAKGVGVLLKWPNGSQAVPNSTNNFSSNGNGTITLFSAALTAQLVKSDTEKVTSGQFSTIGTLQFTYE